MTLGKSDSIYIQNDNILQITMSNLQIFYRISHIFTKEVQGNGAFVAKEISKKSSSP